MSSEEQFKKRYLAAGDKLSDRVRRILEIGLEQLRKQDDPAAEMMSVWIEGRRIENLAEWLATDAGLAEIKKHESRILKAAMAAKASRPYTRPSEDDWIRKPWWAYVGDKYPVVQGLITYTAMTATFSWERSADDLRNVLATLTHIPADVRALVEESLEQEGSPIDEDVFWDVKKAGELVADELVGPNSRPLHEDGATDVDEHLLIFLFLLAKVPRGINAILAPFGSHDWFFLLRSNCQDKGKDWLRELVGIYFQAELDRARLRVSAPVLAVQQVGDFARLPKHTSGMSWAIGGMGVEVDGSVYAEQPGVVGLIPTTASLLPKDAMRKPHQGVLALDYGEEEFVAMAVARSSGGVISPVGGKLGIIILAAQSKAGGALHKATIRDLACQVFPDAKKLQAREYKAVARGLRELDSLYLYLLNGTKLRVFDVQTPWTPELVRSDSELWMGLAGGFQNVLHEVKSGPFHGEFIVNLSGIMKLPNQRPALIRYYLRTAAHWNASYKRDSSGHAQFDLSRMRRHNYTPDEWAILCNSLPPAAVEYLSQTRSNRTAKTYHSARTLLYRERKTVEKSFEELVAHGLVGKIEKRNKAIIPLPPEDYVEAKRRWQKQGSQKALKAGHEPG